MTREAVNHPAHYNQGGIECIDALASCLKGLDGVEAFCTGNSIKYLWRWKAKNGIEDLNKAQWYLDWLIKYTKSRQQTQELVAELRKRIAVKTRAKPKRRKTTITPKNA